MSPTPTPSSSWAARTQRSSSSSGGTGGAHERHLRRRHRRLHRPDGDAAERDRRGAGRAEPQARAASTPSPPAAAFSPRPTSSRCSTRAPGRRTWPPASFRRWWTRPSPVWRQGRGHRRARCCSWAGPSIFFKGLRQRFQETLKLWTRATRMFPSYGAVFGRHRRGHVHQAAGEELRPMRSCTRHARERQRPLAESQTTAPAALCRPGRSTTTSSPATARRTVPAEGPGRHTAATPIWASTAAPPPPSWC